MIADLPLHTSVRKGLIADHLMIMVNLLIFDSKPDGAYLLYKVIDGLCARR